MPTYEYECRSCGRRFDRLQRITAKPAASCPRCGKSARRLISAGGGLLFKGSGFYITDYRSSGYKRQASKESRPSGPSGSSGGESSSSKEGKKK